MVGSPSGPEPRRFAGCLVRNCGKHRKRQTDRQSPRQGGPETDRERGRQGRRNRETQAQRSRMNSKGSGGRGREGKEEREKEGGGMNEMG